MEYVKKMDIAIEVNPISNQILGLVDDFRNHPASIFMAHDMPIVVSSEDPGFWQAEGISYDFYEVFMGMMPVEADLRALKYLALNSIQYSALNKIAKNAFFTFWNKQWEDFILKNQNCQFKA